LLRIQENISIFSDCSPLLFCFLSSTMIASPGWKSLMCRLMTRFSRYFDNHFFDDFPLTCPHVWIRLAHFMHSHLYNDIGFIIECTFLIIFWVLKSFARDTRYNDGINDHEADFISTAPQHPRCLSKILIYTVVKSMIFITGRHIRRTPLY
jgi:hypothetical protein